MTHTSQSISPLRQRMNVRVTAHVSGGLSLPNSAGCGMVASTTEEPLEPPRNRTLGT